MVVPLDTSSVHAFDGFQDFYQKKDIWYAGYLCFTENEIYENTLKPVHNDQVDSKLDMNIKFASPSLVYKQLRKTKSSNRNSNSFYSIRSNSMSHIQLRQLVSATEIQLLNGYFGSEILLTQRNCCW